MSVSDYSTSPNDNTAISGINIAEGCMPSGINNAIRQMMADAKTEQGARVTAEGVLQTNIDTVTANANGRAPASHASGANTYGLGSNSEYGHVKLSDSISSSSGSGSGIAATPLAVKEVWRYVGGMAQDSKDYTDRMMESAKNEAKEYTDTVAIKAVLSTPGCLRLSDGTQIAWGSTSTGELTFALPFLNNGYSAQATAENSFTPLVATIRYRSTISIQVGCYDLQGNEQTSSVAVLCIGRWK